MNTKENPYESAAHVGSAQGTESVEHTSPQRRVSRWMVKATQYGVITLLSVPSVIAFQIAAMLLTSRGTQGFVWLAIGALWVPTAIAFPIALKEKRNSKEAFISAAIMGVVVTVSLYLFGLLLLVAAGPMDGGI